jgi:hypothetical protein
MPGLFERLAQGRPPVEESRLMPEATSPEARRLLEWLQNKWDQPTICTRDIYRYGPGRRLGKAVTLKLADTLTKRGWLIPLEAHRRDRKRWQITIGRE